ncbi:hypothetical protein BKA93DRAFT_754693 [Sparassis latifolia]
MPSLAALPDELPIHCPTHWEQVPGLFPDTTQLLPMAVPGETNAASGSQVARLGRSFAQMAAEADSSMDDDEGDSFAVSRHRAMLRERIVRLQRELNLTEDMHVANLNASSTVFQMGYILRDIHAKGPLPRVRGLAIAKPCFCHQLALRHECCKALTEGALAMGQLLAITCSGNCQPSNLWRKALTEGALAMGQLLAITCSGNCQPSNLWRWAHPSGYTLGDRPTAHSSYSGDKHALAMANTLTFGDGPIRHLTLVAMGPLLIDHTLAWAEHWEKNTSGGPTASIPHMKDMGPLLVEVNMVTMGRRPLAVQFMTMLGLCSSLSQEAPKATTSALVADAGAMPGPLCEGPLGMPIQVKGETLYHVEQVREMGVTDCWYKAAAATQFYQNAKFHSFRPLSSTPLKSRCTRKAEKKAAQCRGKKTYVVFRGLAPGSGVYETCDANRDEVKAMCIGVSGSLYQQALTLLPPSAQLEQISYDCTNIQLLSSVARMISDASVTLKSPVVALGGNSLSPASGLPSPTMPPLCTLSRSVPQSPGGHSAKRQSASVSMHWAQSLMGSTSSSSVDFASDGTCAVSSHDCKVTCTCDHKWFTVFHERAPGVFSFKSVAKQLMEHSPIGVYREFETQDLAVAEFVFAHSRGHVVTLM